MPRFPKRKTTKGNFSENTMKEAVALVVQGAKCRMVAKKYNLAHQTLARYVKKYKHFGEDVRMRPNYDVRKVFTTDQENLLVAYIIKSAKMMYGLTYADIRNLAYELAVKNDLKRPVSWDEHETAGKEWLVGFMRRHRNLSLRTAEGCSLGRAISFNPTNVNRFFDLLESLVRRYPQFADGSRVYNLDEKGTETVQKSAKVVAETGSSQVSRVKSQERGTLVTTCAIICADGSYLPPAMVFPRVKFKQHMLNGAVPGTLGLANKSGWMTRGLFVEVMKHFIKLTNTSPENPSLLIYDNHESHLSIEALDLAKANGVTVLTIPPHCSNKLQPLDVAVFRAFGNAYDAAINSHTLRNPNTNITIYQVAEFVKRAYDRSMTRNNIASSFRATGIFPFDRDIFTEEDFLPSTVSDRPDPAFADDAETVDQPTNETFDDLPGVNAKCAVDEIAPSTPRIVLNALATQQQNSNSTESGERCSCESSAVQEAMRVLQQFVACHVQANTQLLHVAESMPTDSKLTASKPTVSKPTVSNPTTVKAEPNKNFLTPEDVRSLPNTRSVKQVGKRRAKGRSMIATDTPERNEIAAKQEKSKRVANSKNRITVKIEPDHSLSSAKPSKKSKRRIADEFAG